MRRVTRKYMLLSLVLSTVIGISLVGCSHTPPRPVELDQARMSYAEARDNPQVASRAPVALREAEEVLLRAGELFSGRIEFHTRIVWRFTLAGLLHCQIRL